MSKTNSWLCTYAVAQLGRPYKMGSVGGKITSSQKTLQQKNHQATNKGYTNPNYNESVKTHDCSGLIVGALTCKGVNKSPDKKLKKTCPVIHGASSMWNYNCKNRHQDMDNFDYVPGRVVFLKNPPGSKHPFHHVGIFVGTINDSSGTHKNMVVEAKGRKWGVVFSKVDKWDAWAQLSCCSEDTTVGQVFTYGGGVDPQSLIKVSAIDPYLAIIGPIASDVDYAELRKFKVSAMMFNAGSLYNIQHKKKTYINPFLDSQVTKCLEANMPFALYADVKAHNEIEADAECKALYYILDLYPPKFGIWLKMDTGQGVSMNDKIINVYYKYITEWGLKGRCGIYIDIAKLSTISWSSFQDKFYLLGIDKSIDYKKVEGKLLQPSMFEVK